LSRTKTVEVPAHLEFLTPLQVASIVGCHEETVTRALRGKKLKGFRRGDHGHWKVRRQDALDWVESGE
jgi:excisionase family DNA binding protein